MLNAGGINWLPSATPQACYVVFLTHWPSILRQHFHSLVWKLLIFFFFFKQCSTLWEGQPTKKTPLSWWENCWGLSSDGRGHSLLFHSLPRTIKLKGPFMFLINGLANILSFGIIPYLTCLPLIPHLYTPNRISCVSGQHSLRNEWCLTEVNVFMMSSGSSSWFLPFISPVTEKTHLSSLNLRFWDNKPVGWERLLIGSLPTWMLGFCYSFYIQKQFNSSPFNLTVIVRGQGKQPLAMLGSPTAPLLSLVSVVKSG